MERVTQFSSENSGPCRTEDEVGCRARKFDFLFLEVLPAGILLATGIGKVIAAFGHGQILKLNDPVFQIPFWGLLLLSGCIEVAIGTLAVFSKYTRARMVLIAWMSTCFIVYRLGLALMGWHAPCACLGALSDALHIAPQVADRIAVVLLGYLLVVSYGWLLVHRGMHSQLYRFAKPAIILLLSSCGFSHRVFGHQYEVSGRISGARYLARGNVRKIEPLAFQVFVNDCKWMIEAKAIEPNSRGMIWQMSSDGQYQYKLGKLSVSSSTSGNGASWGGSNWTR